MVRFSLSVSIFYALVIVLFIFLRPSSFPGIVSFLYQVYPTWGEYKHEVELSVLPEV